MLLCPGARSELSISLEGKTHTAEDILSKSSGASEGVHRDVCGVLTVIN